MPELVVPGENGTIAHAQLKFGNGMIMLGSVRDGAYDRLVKQPSEVDGTETQAPYIVVEDADADAHYARAKSAGAEILMGIEDQDYGGGPILAAILKATSGILTATIRGRNIEDVR